MKVNRLSRIASVFAEEGLGYLTGKSSTKLVNGDDIDVGAEAHPDREKARRLKRVFERLGPTFVKFGQMLANRVDLFSEEFTKELSSLHAEVPPFDNTIAMQLIETETGRSVQEVFSEISPSPVASASIAQVYRATLKDSGEEVAIKVQRPNLHESLLEDLELIVQMSSWFDTLIPSYRKSMMHVVAKEYATRSRMELDFTMEAQAIQEFGETYAHDPYFSFPKVYFEHCSDKIIVMQWFSGPRLGQVEDIKALEELGYDATELAHNLIKFQLSMAYEHGLLHADMHPGNLILLENAKVGVIDCGLHARVPKKTREQVLKMLLLQAQGRIEERVDISIELSPPADKRDLPKFRQDLIDHYRKPQVRSPSSVSKDIIATMRIGTKYRNYANPFLLMIVRNMLILEGIMLKFAPDFDPIDVMGDNIKDILMRRFSPQAVFNNFSPVIGELALALHNRPALLSRILHLESKFIEAPTLGDFLRSEQVIIDKPTNTHPWIHVLIGAAIGALVVFAIILLGHK